MPDLNGLAQREAEARLVIDGYNEQPSDGGRSALATLREVLREPMLALLIGAGFIYLLLGDVNEALVLIVFAGLSILITVVQERRTERALDALREYSAPRALVIRDGERRHMPARELVSGDIVVLAEGDRVAADGWVLESDGLQADEALLTGESVPVRKAAAPEESQTLPLPGGDDLPYVFSGSLIVRGCGLIHVAATGPRSEIGKIGQSLAVLDVEAPRLTIQTRRLVRWFAGLGLGVSLLATLLYGLLRGGWLEAMLAGIALGMSMLPEEFPVVLTVFMAMGALRMSRARVLTRRGAAIETLGAATVLCTDKTGTLTQNRMEIAQLRLPDGQIFTPDKSVPLVLPEAFVELAGLGILACTQTAFDPMETAFHDLGERHEGDSLTWRQESGWTLHRHYPLHPELLAMTHIWGSNAGDEHVVATKGAPEAIAELCSLDAGQRNAMDNAVNAMASEGLRVLAVAEARWTGESFPETQRDFAFAFRGLVGLADPIRETVPDAIHQLRSAGLRVVMITGDYPQTARAIARAAGIGEGGVLTGPELAGLDEAALTARIRDVTVFARVMPNQKLRIVQALKAAGEIVAMTGDGVNDAPSLKAAHIGIAMGKRGTDVAREASAIILLDDDFGTIVAAVRLGRRIYDNLRKAMGFIVAVHMPIAGLALLPLLTGWPLILGPMHIALLEMIIDPTCSLAFEAEDAERNVLQRPPRRPEAPLFSRVLVSWSVLQGCAATAAVVLLTVWTQQMGLDEMSIRATAFAGLVAVILVLVLINRSFGGSGIQARRQVNVPLVIILSLVIGGMTILLGVESLSGPLRLGAFSAASLAAVVAAAALTFILLAMLKRYFRASLAG